MTILENVKSILGITDNNSDIKLNFYIETLNNKILNMCNINSLPKELNHLVIQYAIEQHTLNKDTFEGVKEVINLSDNGQSVSFKTVGGASSMSVSADEFIRKNKSEIYNFREPRW